MTIVGRLTRRFLLEQKLYPSPVHDGLISLMEGPLELSSATVQLLTRLERALVVLLLEDDPAEVTIDSLVEAVIQVSLVLGHWELHSINSGTRLPCVLSLQSGGWHVTLLKLLLSPVSLTHGYPLLHDLSVMSLLLLAA